MRLTQYQNFSPLGQLSNTRLQKLRKIHGCCVAQKKISAFSHQTNKQKKLQTNLVVFIFKTNHFPFYFNADVMVIDDVGLLLDLQAKFPNFNFASQMIRWNDQYKHKTHQEYLLQAFYTLFRPVASNPRRARQHTILQLLSQNNLISGERGHYRHCWFKLSLVSNGPPYFFSLHFATPYLKIPFSPIHY